MTSKIFEFSTARRLIIGPGCSEMIGEVAKGLGGEKALVVCDKGVVGAGLLDRIIESVKSERIAVEVFDKVVSNPTTENVEDGLRLLKERNCGIVVALGGGSVLDCAKAISVMATNPGQIKDYDGIEKIPKRMLPLIAVNTTGGTGSEVTQWAVITDQERKIKMTIGSSNMMPDVAIDDPLLAVSMPPSITATTGMDALTHAIEGYVAKFANPLTDSLALRAINLIAENLRIAFADGENLSAREGMLYGQMLAGMCFCYAGVGNVHAMAHQLGGMYDIPHGLANAILLPYVMEFNLVANPPKFAEVARAMGESIEGLSIREAAQRAIIPVYQLSRDLQIPATLKEIGVREEDIPILAENAMKDLTIETNPRITSPVDLKSIYERAFRGEWITEPLK
jgi:alcohol dehydrogenase